MGIKQVKGWQQPRVQRVLLPRVVTVPPGKITSALANERQKRNLLGLCRTQARQQLNTFKNILRNFTASKQTVKLILQ